MGRFLLSKGMESTGAHTRIAVTVVRFVGADEPKRLIMGFMLAAALHVDFQHCHRIDAIAGCARGDCHFEAPSAGNPSVKA